MRWGRDRSERPPRLGARMLAKAALACVLVILSTGAGVAGAGWFQIPIPEPPGPDVPVPPNLPDDAPVEKVEPGGPRTILVLGSDRRSKRSADGTIGFEPHSDTMLLIRLDPKRHRIATLSVPRDLAVTIPGHGDGMKINQAYTEGQAALSAKTVKYLFETTAAAGRFPINSIVDVNFDGFQRMVNEVGGVYVDVDHDYYVAPETGTSAIDIKAGYQRLVGSQALAYVRFRHTDSDIYRQARQQDFLRQAAHQPSVRKVQNFTDANRLLGIMRGYMRADKNFWTRRNLAGMLKTAVYLGVNHAPVNQIPFSGVTDAPNRDVDTRLYISQENLQRIYTQFMTGEDTRNPAPRKTTVKRKAVKAAKVTGLEDARNLGENLAVLADPKLRFPFYFPAYRRIGSRYPDSTPRLYKLTDEQRHKHEAYRIVIDMGPAGEYYGVQGTTWTDPPFLENPDRTVKQNGRRLLLFYDGRKLRAVGWKTPKAAYWVSNTVTHSIPNPQLIAIAASLTHLRQ